MTVTTEIESWTACICTVYAVPMPEDAPATSGKTPGRLVRFQDDLWDDYGKACDALGTNRSDDLRRHAVSVVAAWKREQRRIARESGDS